MKTYSKEEKARIVANGEAKLGLKYFLGYGLPHAECNVHGCVSCFNLRLDRLVERSEAALRPAPVALCDIEWAG